MGDTASYVYCVAKAARKPVAPRALAGLPGAGPARVLDAGGSLWIVCASVPLASYGPGALETSLRDLPWVSDIAVAHESVVEHFAARKDVTVVPMKMFTMFSSDDRALDEMRSRRRDILAVVRRIAGCEEWGVRITRRVPDGSGAQPDTARPASGSAFLAGKKEARDRARGLARAATESAERAYETLTVISRDARRRDDAPAGAVPPLLDAAFLVPAARRARFKAAARRLAALGPKAGTDITITGPWPAYNFVQQDGRS